MAGGSEAHSLLLGTGGRHFTIDGHRDPEEDEIRRSEATPKARGLSGWLVLMKGGYFDTKRKPELMMIHPFGEPAEDWKDAVAAFETIRQKAVHST